MSGREAAQPPAGFLTASQIKRYNKGERRPAWPVQGRPAGRRAFMSGASMLASSLIAAENVGTEEQKTATVWLLLFILFLMAVLIGTALFIAALGRWSKQPPIEKHVAGTDLASFRLLYERGECTQEEYERIRARLGKKLRKEMNVPDPEKKGADTPEASQESPRPCLPSPDSGATIERTDGPAVGGSDPSSKSA